MVDNLAPIYTVNYQAAPTQNYVTQWSAYSSSTFLAACNAAKDLGFNTLRIFVTVAAGCFDFPTPQGGQLANLTNACNQAVATGMRLHVCFFEHFGLATGTSLEGYGQIAAAKTWATSIIGAITASNMTITSTPATSDVIIELQNEPYYDSPAAYIGTFDNGWPGYPIVPPSPTVGQVTTTFAQQVIPYLRSNSGAPVCTSATAHADNEIAYQVANFTGTQIPDWYEWHSYPSNTTFQGIYANILPLTTSTGGQPLYIGETGVQSFPDNSTTRLAQQTFLLNERAACGALGLPEPAPWMLYDSSNQSTNWGLYDVSGVLKLSGEGYLYAPLGSYREISLSSGGLVYG